MRCPARGSRTIARRSASSSTAASSFFERSRHACLRTPPSKRARSSEPLLADIAPLLDRTFSNLGQAIDARHMLKEINSAQLEVYGPKARDALMQVIRTAARGGNFITAAEAGLVLDSFSEIRVAATRFVGQGDMAMVSEARGKVPIFVRANPRFHLSSASDHPLILVGTGTGIGPFMGMLEQAGRSARSAHTCLVFGDRRSSSDFLYEDRIRNWERSDVVGSLITAFSRDSAEPYYVQHALMENADHIWQLLDQGAHVYVCGNKANLDRSIDDVIRNIAARAGGLPADRAEHFVHELVLNERLHKELY